MARFGNLPLLANSRIVSPVKISTRNSDKISNTKRSFSLKNFLRNQRIRDFRDTRRDSTTRMSTVTATTDLRKPGVGGQPCLSLVPAVKGDVDATELVQFTLKVRAGSAVNAPIYKRKVARFNSGTPAEWIAVLEALEEIFAQNSVVTAQDRENVIRTILRGDSWTAFESSIVESRVNPEDLANPVALDIEMISTALKAVSH